MIFKNTISVNFAQIDKLMVEKLENNFINIFEVINESQKIAQHGGSCFPNIILLMLIKMITTKINTLMFFAHIRSKN